MEEERGEKKAGGTGLATAVATRGGEDEEHDRTPVWRRGEGGPSERASAFCAAWPGTWSPPWPCPARARGPRPPPSPPPPPRRAPRARPVYTCVAHTTRRRRPIAFVRVCARPHMSSTTVRLSVLQRQASRRHGARHRESSLHAGMERALSMPEQHDEGEGGWGGRERLSLARQRHARHGTRHAPTRKTPSEDCARVCARVCLAPLPHRGEEGKQASWSTHNLPERASNNSPCSNSTRCCCPSSTSAPPCHLPPLSPVSPVPGAQQRGASSCNHPCALPSSSPLSQPSLVTTCCGSRRPPAFTAGARTCSSRLLSVRSLPVSEGARASDSEVREEEERRVGGREEGGNA